ncbi:hypothetical protein ACQXY3_10975 [Corynebacterium diphtheriae]|uniref:hypothetical protein n=1 Tax=Corynebacterium diphtheriae TaxID=1717 RepID=UPI0013CCC405|nr:hypothetical protein CIP107533_01834 [Corynebacterium diphtheriae]CAB0575955.1 hypothetical protein CIP107532_01969 [Corynebacterium diphtheriae]CAB0612299.1 hypothetical protein CIP107550_01826 [Corynebacterium diphtheriae]CAB0660453.1 hypothetical protein CIP107562_01791 [Corynebacterium diphtheriae]CAB0661234.1 hypothetical protein CIP107580_01812 [Corynebacterium diphtheriae]
MDELEKIYGMETFEEGGRILFEGLRDVRDPVDVEQLVIEVCRVKDRLDTLNRLVTFDVDTWATLTVEQGSKELIVKIDGALREQRQTETVFRQLLAEISRRRGEYRDDDDDDDQGGLSGL